MQDSHPLSVRKIHNKIAFALPPAYRRFIRAHDFDMIEALYLTLATEKEGCRFNRGLLFSYNQDNGSLDYVRGVGVFNGNDAKAQYNELNEWDTLRILSAFLIQKHDGEIETRMDKAFRGVSIPVADFPLLEELLSAEGTSVFEINGHNQFSDFVRRVISSYTNTETEDVAECAVAVMQNETWKGTMIAYFDRPYVELPYDDKERELGKLLFWSQLAAPGLFEEARSQKRQKIHSFKQDQEAAHELRVEILKDIYSKLMTEMSYPLSQLQNLSSLPETRSYLAQNDTASLDFLVQPMGERILDSYLMLIDYMKILSSSSSEDARELFIADFESKALSEIDHEIRVEVERLNGLTRGNLCIFPSSERAEYRKIHVRMGEIESIAAGINSFITRFNASEIGETNEANESKKPNYTYLDVNSTLQDRISDFRKIYGEGVHFDAQFGEDIPFISRNKTYFAEDITNILAYLYSKLNGRGRVEVHSSYDREEVRLGFTTEDFNPSRPYTVQSGVFSNFTFTKERFRIESGKLPRKTEDGTRLTLEFFLPVNPIERRYSFF